jgi:hypothetical protein
VSVDRAGIQRCEYGENGTVGSPSDPRDRKKDRNHQRQLEEPEPSFKQRCATSRPSVPRCPILFIANSLVTEAMASPVMPIASSSPSLTLPNPTRTHRRISWHVPPTRLRRHPLSPSFPQTSRRQNRTRHCKICQRESGILAHLSARSHPCLLRCSAPDGRSWHPSYSPQSSRLREIGCCERALGDALEWRLWVGKVPSLAA